MNYKRVKNNEWIRPQRNNYKMMCCDCGLVHIIDFKLEKHGKNKVIMFKAKRDNRATGQARRYNKKVKVWR